jgi:hypothetical protein
MAALEFHRPRALAVTALFPLLLLVLAVCQNAHASAVMYVSLDDQGRYLDPFDFIDRNGKTSGYGGVFLATLDGSNPYPVFCVDLYTDVNPGSPYSVDILSPDDTASLAYSSRLPQAAWLYVTYMPLVDAASNKAVAGAALQLAIWDVVEDGGDGLSSGSIRVDSAITNPTNIAATNLASSMIAAAQGQSLLNAAVLMNVVGPDGSQTLITAADAFAPVPEPSTMALLGVGLLSVAMLKSRRPRRH